MKLTKKRLAVSIAAIAILVVSLAVALCDALIPLDIWVHPILTFLFCIFVGFGVMCLVFGFTKKSPWYFFLSAIFLGLAFVYAFCCSVPDFWWISLIVVAVIWAIFAILSFMSSGSHSEDIALNKSPDYKNYEQRKADRERAESEKQPEPLPEIKSFKDEK